MNTKTYYLDIDMDYFVYPIEKASVDNVRLYRQQECTMLPVSPLVEGLRASGLSWGANIHCFTNHKKSYTYWWMSKKQNCTVIHIDAHSDLYRNYNKDLRLLGNGDVGCYNYLWYAIRDGYADEIYWIVPDSLKYIVSKDKAEEIINKNLIDEAYVENGILNINFNCICLDGIEKEISVKVCTIDELPFLDAVCDKVTIATSPEFIPEKADMLIFELFKQFGVSDDIAQNIYNQHKDILNKSEEEIIEAKKRLGI